mgnify:CR=1 FL=1
MAADRRISKTEKTAHTIELSRKNQSAKAKNLLFDEALELMKNTKVSTLWIGNNHTKTAKHLNIGLLFSVFVHLGILALIFKSPAWEISEWVQTPITNNISVDILSALAKVFSAFIESPTILLLLI